MLGTPYWSMISSVLHLVGLRPLVYYTLTNFRGGGGGARPPWPPLNMSMMTEIQYMKFEESVLFEMLHFPQSTVIVNHDCQTKDLNNGKRKWRKKKL